MTTSFLSGEKCVMCGCFLWVLSQIQRKDNFISIRRDMCHVWVFLVGVVTDPAL